MKNNSVDIAAEYMEQNNFRQNLSTVGLLDLRSFRWCFAAGGYWVDDFVETSSGRCLAGSHGSHLEHKWLRERYEIMKHCRYDACAVRDRDNEAT